MILPFEGYPPYTSLFYLWESSSKERHLHSQECKRLVNNRIQIKTPVGSDICMGFIHLKLNCIWIFWGPDATFHGSLAAQPSVCPYGPPLHIAGPVFWVHATPALTHWGTTMSLPTGAFALINFGNSRNYRSTYSFLNSVRCLAF